LIEDALDFLGDIREGAYSGWKSRKKQTLLVGFAAGPKATNRLLDSRKIKRPSGHKMGFIKCA
jgi:hypothetical protein